MAPPKEDKKAASNGAPPPQQGGSQGEGGSSTGSSNEVDFAKVSLREAYELLNASSAGLSSQEAAARLAEYGPNRLPEASVNPFLRFMGYLWNPLSWAMEVAAILAIILLDYADFVLILALLLLNATISFVEESNADKAIKALAGALAPRCKVYRDGGVKTLDAAELVPGDVIVVRLGDIVPADIKLLGEDAAHGSHGDDSGSSSKDDKKGGGGDQRQGGEAKEGQEEEEEEQEQPMQIDQAALTGESLPVKKRTGDVAFSGSSVKQGERLALVYATGCNTFFGRAAALISGTNNTANIAKVMTRIGAMCLVTIGVWVVVEIAVQFSRGHNCRLGEGMCPTLSNLLVIIVGGIPIAMPTVLSVTLALGAFELAKHGAIVARMSAVEEMAGMDVLCSDKTGTLTLNKLSIDTAAAKPAEGVTVPELVRYGALSADVASEEAIDVVLHATYPDQAHLWDGLRAVKRVPFNPVDKFTLVTIEEAGAGGATATRVFRLMKGAPQVVLKRSSNFAAIKGTVERQIVDFANRGYRALGFAIAEGAGAATSGSWRFLGLLPLFDPPRHDTAHTIEQCQAKGIGVKMITGDQKLIGVETARQLGMGTNIHSIDVLLKAKAGTGLVDGAASVEELVENADGFAEVYPEHKFEIVKILQERNHMVGMTGDGVNDAPALKRADVGIAVHGATEAARGAADIVLTEPGLSVIVEAVVGARRIFSRMTTYAKYTVAMTFRVCFTFGILTIAYDWFFPTILIVILAVLNDGAMIALSKDRVTPSPTPNSWRLRDIFIVGITYGLYLTLSTWVLYHVAVQTTFFERSFGLNSLNSMPQVLLPFCAAQLQQLGIRTPSAPAAAFAGVLGPGYAAVGGGASVLDQCLAEQRFVRGAQLRSLIYNAVSVSGQALVFVVRTPSHSLTSRAGTMTYLAFAGAQVCSTLIAAFGFNGFSRPAFAISGCALCRDSNGAFPAFFPSRTVPIAGTESVHTASVIGCGAWVLVAWVWSIIWYMGLDPLKFLLMWALNEDGVRSRVSLRRFLRARPAAPTKTGEEAFVTVGPQAATYANPLGRASVLKPDPRTLSRASVVRVDVDPVTGLRRVSMAATPRASADLSAALANPATIASPTPLRRATVTASGRLGGVGSGSFRPRGSVELAAATSSPRGSAELPTVGSGGAAAKK